MRVSGALSPGSAFSRSATPEARYRSGVRRIRGIDVVSVCWAESRLLAIDGVTWPIPGNADGCSFWTRPREVRFARWPVRSWARHPKCHSPLMTSAVRVSRCVCAWMTVFGATLSSMVYKPDVVWVAEQDSGCDGRQSRRAGAGALTRQRLDLLRCQTSLRLTVLSRGHDTQCEPRCVPQETRLDTPNLLHILLL